MHAWNAPKVNFHQSYVSVPGIFPRCISMFQVYYQDIVSAFKYIASMYVIVVTPYQNQVKAWATLTKTIMVPNYNQVFVNYVYYIPAIVKHQFEISPHTYIHTPQIISSCLAISKNLLVFSLIYITGNVMQLCKAMIVCLANNLLRLYSNSKQHY